MRARGLTFLLIGLLALGGASALRPSLLALRQSELGAAAPGAPPPDVAVASVFLGAFRGLVVDYLWLRAIRLSDDGKYFEALDLAEAITRLEPRLEQVWSFEAHALAYNASAAADDGPTRFRWIENGITLLRDQGLAINPRSPELYYALSRIYSDRVGQMFDANHLYFKKSVALELAHGLGRPGQEIPLETLAQAPESFSKLEPEVQRLGKELTQNTENLAEFDDLLASESARKTWESARDDPARRDAAQKLEAFARASWLRKRRLDPKLLLAFDKEWGPVDWRGCDGMALYWAAAGIRAARTLEHGRGLREEHRLERLALAAVRAELRRGRLVIEPSGEVFFAPMPQLVPRVLQLFTDTLDRARKAEARGESWGPEEPVDEEEEKEHGKQTSDVATPGTYRFSIEEATKDLYPELIMMCAQYGHDAEGKRLYAEFQKKFPDLAGTSGYDALVNEILRNEVLGDEGGGATLASTQRILFGAWSRAWYALALGDDERALGLASLAKRTRDAWEKFIWERYGAEGENEKVKLRLGSSELNKVKQQAFEDVRKRLSGPLKQRLEERAGMLGEGK